MAVSSEIFHPSMLAGRVALVTGGGTGLGKASARELLACGASVVIAGRREDVLREAAAELGESCSFVAGDIRSPEGAAAIVAACGDRVDVLVNNAGGQYFVPAESIALKGWNAVWRLNVGGTMTMIRAAQPVLSPDAVVMNVTFSPHHGLPGMTHSGAARAAVEALTSELAAELDPVTVVALAAGHFRTEAIKKYPAGIADAAARTVPLQRLGEEEEHAWLVALLASPLGRCFSGTVVTLDGARDNWYGPWPPPGLVGEGGEVPTEERRAGR
ncbi:MAG: SDR family oxidoreductase [Actinomycetota bacterium]|nr:SDR family oxidoreductase [Actinomycetota bacterium]MDQ5807815.1 SDR family oxidoreductase [Actinomycetota bacterium]